MSSSLSSASSGSLVFRNYQGFRGVDFSSRKDEVAIFRSPDALNVWKNYKGRNGNCIETRPELEIIKECKEKIYGFYMFNEDMILHIGTKLYDEDKLIYEYMPQKDSKFFI